MTRRQAGRALPEGKTILLPGVGYWKVIGGDLLFSHDCKFWEILPPKKSIAIHEGRIDFEEMPEE